MRALLLARVGLVIVSAAAVSLLGAASVIAASKYKACSLLTAAEVEAVLKKRISKTDEGDIIIPEGLYKGEVMSGCNWIAGETHAWLTVIRGPRTPQERAESQAILRDTFEALKKQGWSVQEQVIGVVECVTGRPPAGTSGNPSFVGCGAEKGGLAFSISTMGTGVPISAEQVKSLSDKAASRIR